MAKIDKSQYTKEEWRIIKEKRRLEKQTAKLEKVSENVPVSLKDTEEKFYVLCLKHGTKYSHEYVNNLYRMVDRNITVPYEFVCLTENTYGLDPSIKTLPLPKGLEGWWYKPYMFSNTLPLKGTILFMDLDVVISGNLDKLFTYEPDKWCIIRDFTKVMRSNWNRYNSSVIRFKHGQLHHVWEKFQKNSIGHIRRLHGDQDFLWEADKSGEFWPDDWIMSWKWEIRKDRTFAPGSTKGNRKLKNIENVKPPKNCCITVFHGDPNPHNCDDPWVKENWK
jgi:hypothetical protein